MIGKSLILVFALIKFAHGDARLNFIYYHGPTISATTQYNVANFHTIFNHPLFVRHQNALMFHFGSGQNLATSQVNDFIISYFNRREHNLIVINYDDSSVISTDNANALAQGIATANINLFDFGYNPTLMNLVGFGLGAQIIARSSRQVQEQTGRQHIVGRLTGLEPLLLGPVASFVIGNLNSSDAQFVESIHTDGNGQRGDLTSNGHVSFFVNGGVNQPQCTQTAQVARWNCNHNFALTYWAEAARSAVPIFPSLSCETWANFVSGACNSNHQANMGHGTYLNNNHGSFMLRTNLTPPFSRPDALP